MIIVDHLSKRYGSVHAVRDLTFEARPGEVLGFLGPNGAGKSTTMRILTGFLCPTAGRASVGGYDVVDRPLEARRRIGYLPEHTPVYTDMTVYEYLRFVADARGVPSGQRRSAIEAAARDCGLETVIGRSIGHLSKGFRQRTCLAQALVHRPDVLILDEPTSGLDPNQIVEIRSLVSALGRERTVIWSTHILSEVEALCARVLIINEGRAVALGSPSELKARIPGSRPLRLVVDLAAAGSAAGESAAEGTVADDVGAQPAGVNGRLGEVLEAIESLSGVLSATAVGGPAPSEERELRVRPVDGQDVRDDLFDLARARGWRLRALAAIEPTLEDVFRYLTRGALPGEDGVVEPHPRPAAEETGRSGDETASTGSASTGEEDPS